jgi:Flp pilus assembly pilin Flp
MFRQREERGASLVEYALLLALIAVVAIGALTFLGSSTNTNQPKLTHHSHPTVTVRTTS